LLDLFLDAGLIGARALEEILIFNESFLVAITLVNEGSQGTED
jgi:hypothetical protein